MPCYKPLEAFVKRSADPLQKARVSFTKYLRGGLLTPIPCGQCIGCRLERSRAWAIRLMKEYNLHDRSSFLTLTYQDSSLPKTRSKLPTLNLEHTQLFMKRLRKRFSPASLRFFLCGEYGESTLRPHYHLILFGENFSADRKPIRASRSGFPQWESPTLNSLWGLGHCTISDVSFESAAYVARYNLKKFTGKGSKLFYRGRKPEFVTMSRRPGIAHDYFQTYASDIYPTDEIVPSIGRPECLPPKYFDKLLEKVDPVLFHSIKKIRENSLDTYDGSLSSDTRLKTRGRVKAALIKNCLKRTI